MAILLPELLFDAARRAPTAEALNYRGATMTYAALAAQVRACAAACLEEGLGRGERVAVYLEKRVETVIAVFGASAAGGAFVPVNPLLKPEQVAYILADCNVRILVTSVERLPLLAPVLGGCPDLRTVLVVGEGAVAPVTHVRTLRWNEAVERSEPSGSVSAGRDSGASESGGSGSGSAGSCSSRSGGGGSGSATWPFDWPAGAHRVIDTDMTAILYTSGSTGKPKGVVLSHRNMVAGAVSVATYLENVASDRILSALPLSFDA